MESVFYHVEVVFPDGHIEDINNHFTVLRDAVEFGNGMLAQIASNEHLRARDIDIFDERESVDPYFMVVEVKGKKRKLVYDSRRY